MSGAAPPPPPPPPPPLLLLLLLLLHVSEGNIFFTVLLQFLQRKAVGGVGSGDGDVMVSFYIRSHVAIKSSC